MKKMLLSLMLAYPLFVSWDVNWKVPGACPKGQNPDTYTGACLLDGKSQMSRQFTEKADYEEWMKNIPKATPQYSISNVTVFQADAKMTGEVPRK